MNSLDENERRPDMSIACGCGERLRNVSAFVAHRDSGACPCNAPSGAAKFVHWALGIGHGTITAPRTEEERARQEEKREKDRARFEAMRSDPEVLERVRLKRERARLEALRAGGRRAAAVKAWEVRRAHRKAGDL